jgi:hypothetical protein
MEGEPLPTGQYTDALPHTLAVGVALPAGQKYLPGRNSDRIEKQDSSKT